MTRRPRPSTTVLLSMSLLLVFPLFAAEPLVVTKDTAGTFYRDFKRLTDRPKLVAPVTAILCGIPSAQQLEKDRAIAGPHANFLVHVYANPSAADAMASKAAEFPVGAVIVKEKLGRDNLITGVGGMIKRAPGYDTANGDWEFFFHTPGAEFRTGKLENCVDCHNGARRDHVFQAWKHER